MSGCCCGWWVGGVWGVVGGGERGRGLTCKHFRLVGNDDYISSSRLHFLGCRLHLRCMSIIQNDHNNRSSLLVVIRSDQMNSFFE